METAVFVLGESFSSLPAPPSTALRSIASLLRKWRGGHCQAASWAPHAASGVTEEPNQSLLVVPGVC